jgi:leucyl aminopeptidase
MEFNVKSGHPEKQKTACLIAGIFENRKLSPIAEQLDDISEGYISNILRKGDIDGKPGQILLLHNVPNTVGDRVLLVGCGRDQELEDNQYRDIIKKIASTLSQTGASDAVCFITELTVKGRDISWKIRQAVEVILDSHYIFDNYRSKKESTKRQLRRITFTVPTRRELPLAERAILQGQAIANGVNLAKNLGNHPPNVCTPIYLAKEAELLSKQFPSISTGILDEKEIKALKMGAFLAVAKGSDNPPRLITLEYRGRKDKQKPVVLIGKGITFDTGGNSIKPAMGMIGMKYDMGGAASVLGTLRAAAELELPVNLVGVIPTAENMPGSSAARPEDIVTSMSGMTVEILNTDAEGRVILCDALTYSERFDPDVVIDIATLTGACLAALGRFASGLLSNHNSLADDLLHAGNISGDRCWQLPLWDDYQDSLASAFADVANISNIPEAGAITAACFLSRFAKKFHWAHLDVAGTASTRSTGKDRGATGRPVPLLVQYLIDRCTKS